MALCTAFQLLLTIITSSSSRLGPLRPCRSSRLVKLPFASPRGWPAVCSLSPLGLIRICFYLIMHIQFDWKIRQIKHLLNTVDVAGLRAAKERVHGEYPLGHMLDFMLDLTLEVLPYRG